MGRFREHLSVHGPAVLAWLLLLIVMATLSKTHFLLFHAAVELFTICVAFAMFIIAWNSRARFQRGFLGFIGSGYAAAALLDLLHTLAYEGMGVFRAAGADTATQLWIAARYVQAFTFLLTPLWLSRRGRMPLMIAAFAAIDGVLLLFIFGGDWLGALQFPTCFVTGVGQTPFKIVSEYVISLLLVGALVHLRLRRARLDPRTWRLLAAAILLTVLSEITFTSYRSVYGPGNVAGHMLKLLSFYLVYRALVELVLTRPFELLYHDLVNSERRYRALVELSPDAIITHRSDQIHYANAAACALFGGQCPEDLLRRSVTELTHRDDRELMRTRMDESVTRATAPVELRMQRLDGTVVHVEMAGAPAGTADEPAAQVILRDVTERRRAREELRRSAAELRQSNRDLAQFAYAASHHLQEPLRMIAVFVELLRERYEGRLDTQADTYIRFAVDGARRMRELISDLLAYSTAGETAGFEHVSIGAVVAEMESKHAAELKQTGARIVCGNLDVVVAGNRPQLADLFRRLLDNALKFRKPETAPVIRIRAAHHEEFYEFVFEDNGIGFEQEQAERVFLIFQRLHPQEMYGGGTGIGLPICRKIVERHGGRIWVESAPGRGTAFHFTLRAAE